MNISTFFIVSIAWLLSLPLMGAQRPADVSCLSADTVSTAKQKGKERQVAIYYNIKDHLTHEVVKLRKAELLWAADSSFADSVEMKYVESEGWKSSFITTTIKRPGQYLVLAEADSFKTQYVPLVIKKLHKSESYRDMGTIYMRRLPKRQEIDLDEVVIRATKVKFYMDGDTLVYNADAFNLAEGSMLDALLKKLPGVSLEDGGVIKVNGKKVETLLLNGKNFFDSNKELILENMPAYMVKDIQSYERVPERYKGTANEKTAKKELVMNVRLKREYEKGWIANVEGGQGSSFFHNDRGRLDYKFLGRFFGMYFTDKSRLTAYANANNMNVVRTPGEDDNWNPAEQIQGLTTTYSAGLNFSTSKDDAYRYDASLDASYMESEDKENTSSATFLEGGDTYGRSFSERCRREWSLSTAHRMTLIRSQIWKETLKGIFSVANADATLKRWDNHSTSGSATLSDDMAFNLGHAWMDSIMNPQASNLLKRFAINRNTSRGKGKGHSFSESVSGLLICSPAYNDFIVLQLQAAHSLNDRTDKAFEHYYLDYPASDDGMKADFRNRYRPDIDRNWQVNVNPSIQFILDKRRHHSLQWSNNTLYKHSYSNRPLYLLNTLSGWDEAESTASSYPLGSLPSVDEMMSTLDGHNSTLSRSSQLQYTPSLQYSWNIFDEEDMSRYTMLSLAISSNINRETLDYQRGTQIDTLARRTTTLLSANMSVFHTVAGKGRDIDFAYGFSKEAPSMIHLLNIHDDSNPLYITQGNSHLSNSSTHSLSFSYRDKYGKTMFNTSLSSSIRCNAVAMESLYDKTTGVQTVTPRNINGNWNTVLNVSVDMPLAKNDRWRWTQEMGHTFTNSVDLTGTDATMTATKSTVRTHFLSDHTAITWTPCNKVEIAADGRLTYQSSSSSRIGFTPTHALSFQYGARAQINLPWDIQMSTDLTMYSRRGYSEPSMNTNELVWNARLAKSIPKCNLTFLFDGFDILGNLSNVRRYINAQGRTETFYNVIPSYGLLHVVWRFSKKPKKA